MRIRLVAFASASQLIDSMAPEIELPDGATVADLTLHLARHSPALAAQLPRFALAVDGELARADRRLVHGAEVALLPPVSGG